MGISNLFKTKSQEVQPAVDTLSVQNEDSRRPTETYIQYGTRICGKVTGNTTAFSAMLQKVYNAEKQRQVEDKQLQAQRKAAIQNEINSTDNAINGEKVKVNQKTGIISDHEETKAKLEEELVEAKNQHGEINKTARVKMFVGCIILIPLTVYLFLFYTQTFQKGFQGLMDMFTVYFAPIIFFGLGYALHFFNVQENKMKYVKIGAVLIATFLFDGILAYNIAEMEYNEWAVNQLENVPPYSISMAASDLHVWGVIFCGFVAYIIWGIVFDMTITAYENVRSNKKEIQKIENKVRDVKAKITTEKGNLMNIQNKITNLENQKQKLMISLAQDVHIDTQIIKTALSDFHAGWIQLMTALGLGQQQQDQTKDIYDQTLKVLFPECITNIQIQEP